MKCECGGHIYYEFSDGLKIVDICLNCGKTVYLNKIKKLFL
ncbi:MAG: hypothetical protein QXQ58_01310 [Candidatus Aenigmatarchaeota archaeon]